MKICKLKLKNLNSFRGEQEIDFESGLLSDASLVAITGPTGAGKTTLLDAICVALYGKTPRLSGTGSQHPRHLISHGEKEGFAEVHFIANDTGYLATWSATQKGAPKGELRYADTDKLITDKLAKKGKSLGSSQNTVSEEVAIILGLDFDAFKRSVMLAQGEFAAFLKAKDEERRKILEATAGIGIYEVLKQKLNDKVSAVEAATTDVLDKLNRIPEASQDQLKGAETELERLQSEVEALGTHSQRIQNEKQREEGRKADFERLQASKYRQDELTDQQPDIDTLQTTLENANRADRLRPEKQMYDTAKSDLENVEKALDTATTEKTQAETQVKTDQTVYDEKEKASQTTSDEHAQKMPLYRNAKLDVARAADQFAEADKQSTALAGMDKQIDEVSRQFAERQTERTELQKQIQAAQAFLDENPLPLDRQQRLTRATRLQAKLSSQENQLETELANKANTEKNALSLKREIKKLTNARQERLSEKVAAETALEDATAHLNALLETGTREEWIDRKQQAAKAQPIAQKYETTQDDLAAAENRLNALNDTAAALKAELEQIETDLARENKEYQKAAEVVQRCEAEKESAIWVNPINQLRQRLQPGEPCSVCGATDHPCADVLEPESDERLQRAEEALASAKAESDTAQTNLQILQTKQIQTEQNKHNTTDQIETCRAEIETLQEETAELLTEWQVIYPDIDVSSVWTSEQFDQADTAIADITEAEQTHAQASNALQIVSQQLETSENSIKRETNDLDAIETQLVDLNNTIADLQEDVTATETRFWESVPDSFHGIAPAAAVKQFDDKIGEVGEREGERDNAKTQLQVLDTSIEADQTNLKSLKERHEILNAEIDRYRCKGETYLNAVRDKTDGLETEDGINAAIDKLEAALQAKVEARDDAEQQLQRSRDLLTEKRSTHRHCERQYKEAAAKLETACQTYFDKLEDVGFDSPEAHNTAFRDKEQMQELTDQIDAYENEKQALELVITELRTRFEETPFDPEALAQIEAQVEEIGEQLQAAQQEVGAQQQKIDDLKDALEKREALGVEVSDAEQELNRWKRLQDTIPRNDLRDFALEIMFEQMGSIANEQLKYLTSERYQLKVEGIGDLTVIDRWNANQERPVETLSGGESFLTSLALALALADLSRGRAQLNSLFLDEGFGTLDTETLDIAIAALEGLRMQGRSIFLISHIQELTRRLPVKINVRKQGNGSSSVDIRG
ncbi:hypothetical protein C6500_07755 [Candidatus Poribacteria bacterium]|nr:MAG: hypothetical protein C6500_07755 [Candidatus Poribacteria bacterium]